MGFGVQKQAKSVPLYSEYVAGKVIRTKQQATVGGKWPLGIIRIYIPASLDGEYIRRVRKTMRRWEDCVRQATGKLLIKFVEFPLMPGIGDVAKVIDNVNTGDVGYVKPNKVGAEPQLVGVKVASDKTAIRALPHELGHTIGLAHEHERPDAPTAVRNHLVSKWGGGAIAANSAARYDTYGTPFDINSIMMYAEEASKIADLTGLANTERGGCMISEQQVEDQTWHPSPGDLEIVRMLYS